jgi:hypothetical protein
VPDGVALATHEIRRRHQAILEDKLAVSKRASELVLILRSRTSPLDDQQ